MIIDKNIAWEKQVQGVVLKPALFSISNWEFKRVTFFLFNSLIKSEVLSSKIWKDDLTEKDV